MEGRRGTPMREVNGKLTVAAPQETQDEMASSLRNCTAGRRFNVTLETRLLTFFSRGISR